MTVLVCKPFSDDLSVGLHQVIGDVSASQVLQRVCSADLDLHTQQGPTLPVGYARGRGGGPNMTYGSM